MPRSRFRIAVAVDRPYRERVNTRSVGRTLRGVLTAERVAGPLSISVVITNDATIRELNKRFRRQDRPTDVLSFQLNGDPRFVSQATATPLGEIVISYQTARRQAQAAGRPFADELAHLLVHGVLHLLGYDHERPRDAKRMRAREEELLGPHVH